MSTILIVDDNANIRFLFACLLDDSHNIMQAADGEEALKLLTECQADLIITDIYMPVMGGLEFVKAVRANNSKVKILVYGIFAAYQEADFFAVGANSCLPKPADLSLLKQVVEELLV